MPITAMKQVPGKNQDNTLNIERKMLLVRKQFAFLI
jgi:hypothetical protein